MRRLTGQGSGSGGSIADVSSSIMTSSEDSSLYADSARDSYFLFLDGCDPTRREPSVQTTNAHASNCFPPSTTDQLIYDFFSPGYSCLDGMFNIDSLLPNSLAYDGLSEIEEPDASDF